MTKDGYDASAEILPGMVCELFDNAGSLDVRPLASAKKSRLIAVENDLAGKDITDAYASGDRVQLVTFKSGDIARMRVANGETVTQGDEVESNSDGYVKTGSTAPIGVALESVDMSDSSGADPDGFIDIQII